MTKSEAELLEPGDILILKELPENPRDHKIGDRYIFRYAYGTMLHVVRKKDMTRDAMYRHRFSCDIDWWDIWLTS